MESFNNVLCMVILNCYMGMIDLKVVYYCNIVLILNLDRIFMLFIWNGKFLEYICFVMGLSLVFCVFKKLFKFVLLELCLRGY